VEGASDLRGEKLGSLSSQLNEAERQRYQIDLALNQIRSHSGNAISRLNSIPAIMEDSRFNSLRQQETDARKTLDSYSKRYGPKHPKMAEARSKLESVQNSLQSRLDLIVAGLEEERKILDANISNLKRQIGATTQEIQQIQRKGHEMSVLRREVETNQQLYDLFLSRFKETRETGELEKVNARVIDPSIPALGPISPNKQKIIATGTFIGVAIGLMIAFLLEMLDKTLKGPKELEKRLNISSLGAIPQLRLKSRRGETPLSHARKSPESFFSESIRTMRTGVLLSGLDSPRKIIVVTSSIPGEGKSTLAMSLANSIGDMEKVLLIDGDMRRPTIAKHWGLAKDAKGLSEFVSQTAKLAECVHHPVEDSKVYVMPSGSVPPNPLELLSSKRFETSLENLASTFNYIIIDSAPTLAVSDALVLSSYATGVIYVIKAMSTPYPMAKDGIKRLQKAKAHIVGGVLNALPIAGNSKGYSKYKYIGYYNKSYYGSYGYSKESRT
jgi:capsular exopolysaccharide synthesis family protein